MIFSFSIVQVHFIYFLIEFHGTFSICFLVLTCFQMRFVHFADDTTVFASDSNINNVHATVNRELVGDDNWLKANRLSLNVSKTS